MRRISSRATYYYKRIFPAFWFGILALFVVAGVPIAIRDGGQPASLMFMLVPLLMAAFGFFIMKKLVFDMVDEVYDAGDRLIVRNGGQEATIALSNIVNVNAWTMMNPPRVTLTLRQPTVFGSEVAFCAPVHIVPFTRSPIIDDLIQRVDAKRRVR